MKRVATVACLLAVAAAAVLTMGAGSDGGSYKVRAIFDNAGFTIAGEDVKVAGVKVGRIDSLDVTKDFKAIVVLDIQDPGYQDFRADATCQVRPQSLIGERFVECSPTQKRAVDAPAPPPLKQIEKGKGKGQYLLPVANTSKTVDLDLVNNVMRLPYRQRLSLIVSELGTGLAGRGKEVNEVIRRADPALKEVDKVLALLASQNRTLAELARNSDTTLAPLARERRHVSSAINASSKVAEATAERSTDLEADIQRLPTFLRELKPTMRRVGALSDEMTPVFSDLGDVAPDINRLLLELGPFSKAGIPALDSLGEAGKIGTPAVKDALPVVKDLKRLGKVSKPVSKTLRLVLESFKEGRGIQRLMDYAFYQVAAINGFDSFGHYLRARLLLNTCSRYFTRVVSGCSSKFAASAAQSSAVSASAAAAGSTDPVLERTSAALAGKDPDSVAPAPKLTTRAREKADRRSDSTSQGSAGRPEPGEGLGGGSGRPDATPADQAGPSSDDSNSTAPLMDYLFGEDGK
jgi:phospholipid/cholesterol/gamma-HCH transport system substrate-binding protein